MNQWQERKCKECKKKLQFTDERYELVRYTFKKSKGLSRRIKSHYCPDCCKRRFGKGWGDFYDKTGKETKARKEKKSSMG